MSSTAAHSLPAASNRGPLRLCVALLVVTTITILKGAMTTSTGSGLAYKTYPTSDGEWLPRSSYTTIPGFLEHFHRLFAMSAGLLALAIALWLQVGRLGDARARRTAWFGGCLILAQGLFGGFGVLLELPAFTSVTHATLAQLTLATFAWLTYQLSDRYVRTAPVAGVPPGSGRKLVLFALAVLVLQTVFGALARHTNSPQAMWTHVGNALVVFLVATIATAFAIGRLEQVPGIKGLARWIVLLLIVQIGLGFVALVIRNPDGKRAENVEHLGTALTISAHVFVGALLTTLVSMLAAHVFRGTRRPLSARELA
jgi:cytochrome c oxidase assembly protein subunit 15